MFINLLVCPPSHFKPGSHKSFPMSFDIYLFSMKLNIHEGGMKMKGSCSRETIFLFHTPDSWILMKHKIHTPKRSVFKIINWNYTGQENFISISQNIWLMERSLQCPAVICQQVWFPFALVSLSDNRNILMEHDTS